MHTAAEFLLTIGGILLLGLFTSAIGRRTFLPRVTLLILFGVLIGRSGFNIIPAVFTDYFDIVADTALVMVGFLLGGKMNLSSLNGSRAEILGISLGAALIAVLFVMLALVAVGLPLELAILLGCIAAATDPAAVYDVVDEMNSPGPFGKLMLRVVAVDDAWALILFSIGAAFVANLNGGGLGAPLLKGLWEIGGAIAVGAIVGFPAAVLTGRVKQGEPILTEALGLVFICGGFALWLEVSFLIAAMVMGMIVASFARHHEYQFHEIEHVEVMVMVVFFVLAGATLEMDALKGLGAIGIAYIVSRTAGKIIGAWLGATVSGSNQATRNWSGLALLPQAGVAIGMALVAATYFPEHRQVLLSIAISSTIFFEIIGPVLTGLAIRRASAG